MTDRTSVWKHIGVPRRLSADNSDSPASMEAPSVEGTSARVSACTPPTPLTPHSAASPADSEPSGPQFPPDFNPDHVPLFPVLTIEVGTDRDGRWRAFLQGEPVSSAAAINQDAAVEMAVEAACDHIDARGWATCRVSAVLTSPGDAPRRHRLILGANGARYDLEAAALEASEEAPPSRRRWWIAAIAAAVVLLLGGGITLGSALSRPPAAAPPAPPPAPTLRAVPVQLPAQAPAGASPAAAWASPGLATASVAVTATRAVVAPTTGGLAVLDLTTGQPETTIATTSAVTAGPWLIRRPAQPPVAVWSESGRIGTIDPAATTPIPAYTTLPANAVLIITEAGVAWRESPTSITVLTATGPEPRTVPADTKVAAVDGGAVTTVNSLGEIFTATTVQPHAPAPVQVSGGPGTLRGVVTVTATTIVSLWGSADGKPVLLFQDRADASTARATVPIPAEVGAPATITEDRSPHPAAFTSGWRLLGAWLINPDERAAVAARDLGPSATINAAHGTTIWATTASDAIRLNLVTKQRLAQPRTQPALAPLSVTDAGTTVLTNNRLYALPPSP